METKATKEDVIDLGLIFRTLKERKKLFAKVLPTVFVLSCAYILCIPRYYASSLSLAPEIAGNSMQGTLGSLASSFGIDLGSMETTDAINPLLYPDLMEDNGFVVDLFSIKVKSADGEIDCNYHDYLAKHQKRPWWGYCIGAIKNIFKSKEKPGAAAGKKDPYILSKAENDIANAVRSNVGITVDKKTAVITINVNAQDPLICKTVADGVKERLQDYITIYRTNKARIDEKYYQKLLAEAKTDYEKARQLYGNYSDANMEVILESYKAKQVDLENDMQLKYNTYSTIMTQYQAAKAKVQERTPAFTVVKGASAPIRPAGPRRMIFVLGMLILAAIGTSAYIVFKHTSVLIPNQPDDKE